MNQNYRIQIVTIHGVIASVDYSDFFPDGYILNKEEILFQNDVMRIRIINSPQRINRSNIKFHIDCNVWERGDGGSKISRSDIVHQNYINVVQQMKDKGWNQNFNFNVIDEMNDNIVRINDLQQGATGNIIEIKCSINHIIIFKGKQTKKDYVSEVHKIKLSIM